MGEGTYALEEAVASMGDASVSDETVTRRVLEPKEPARHPRLLLAPAMAAGSVRTADSNLIDGLVTMSCPRRG